MKSSSLALVAFIACSSSAFAAQLSLDKLYQSYQKSDQTAAAMPEFGKKIPVSGVVLGVKKNLEGNAMLSLGGASADQELARAVPATAGDSSKMGALAAGAKFNATCELGFTMGSSYLSLQSCVLK